MTQLNDLKRLAKTATPGPWFNNKYDRNIRNFDYEKLIGKPFHIMRYPHRPDNYPITHEMWQANGDYIAAANPTAILSMIESYEQLQSKLDKAIAALEEIAKPIDLDLSVLNRPFDNVTCALEALAEIRKKDDNG